MLDKIKYIITRLIIIMILYLLILSATDKIIEQASVLLFILAYSSFIVLLLVNNYRYYSEHTISGFLKNYLKLKEAPLLTLYLLVILIFSYNRNKIYFKILFNIVNIPAKLAALVAVLLIIMLPYISKIVKRIAKKFVHNISAYFKPSDVRSEKHEGYVDKIEAIDKSAFRYEGRKGRMNKFKRPARTLKNLKKIINPAEKIRYAYGLFIEQLVQNEIAIDKSDTSKQIYIKSSSIPGICKTVDSLTVLYDCIRYGMRHPQNNDASLAEKYCEIIIDCLNKKYSSTTN